ncbi:response regulator transcription factor [Lichenifustis flavocetrariae]|uniref:Response regulator transcription factor n=1 Tax=Lichenifustis flavocetrariae TaxID=2949735 RepID=A0AA41YWZ7_9HYPH|nr:response regulator transcription factor [Lichenifustis flavocetrariae]MCW6508835.1 response regulator transcription factor [Lichenifustis flavocetrariae]
MPHVVVVTAEGPAAHDLTGLLQTQEFTTDIIGGSKDVEARLVLACPDLIILDLPPPRELGLLLCKNIRAQESTRTVPIIIVSSRDHEDDRVRGLDAGADDYMVRPLSGFEFIARVRACLRRAEFRGSSSVVLKVGDISLDRDTKRVWRDGHEMRVASTDVLMLECLMERAGRPVTRARLAECLGSPDAHATGRAIDVRVARLRSALRHEGRPDPIRTIRNEGYAFFVE